MKKKAIELLMVCVLLLGGVFLSGQGAKLVWNSKVEEQNMVVVIDPGHGGRDPGKVGVNDELEKDVNLAIAFQLKALLEAADLKVLMTRTEDVGLYDESASNKKKQDLERRCALIAEAEPALVVSIHQNSFQQESERGAQVFYYTGSEQGRQLAELVQNQLVTKVDPDNRRAAKANDNYYMLTQISQPAVIVECGFMSNREEVALLTQEAYQERLAWAIHMGVMQYLSQL